MISFKKQFWEDQRAVELEDCFKERGEKKGKTGKNSKN